MQVRAIQSGEAGMLEAFVAGHPEGSIEQTWAWGELQTRIPGRTDLLVWGVFDGKRLVASILVVRQVMGFGKTWLWCPGGPLLPEKRGREAWDLLLEACTEAADEAGDVFLRVEPLTLAKEGSVVLGWASSVSYLPRDTLELDLGLSEEELLGQRTQKGRYHIKEAQTAGVEVKETGVRGVSERGAKEFYALLQETAARDGFQVHKEAFYREFLRVLGERAKLYLAYFEGQAVSGALVTWFGSTIGTTGGTAGGTATYYFGASSELGGEKRAPYLVQWEAIRAAKKADLKRYDFLGVAPGEAGAAGDVTSGAAKHPLAGVTQFKTRFGGRRVSYVPAQVFVFRPVWWAIYRLGKLFK